MAKQKRKSPSSKKNLPPVQEPETTPEESRDSAEDLATSASSLFQQILEVATVPRVLLLAIVSFSALMILAFAVHGDAIRQGRGEYLYEQGQWAAAASNLQALDFERQLAADGFSAVVHSYIELDQIVEAMELSRQYLEDIQTALEADSLSSQRRRQLESEKARLLGFSTWGLLEAERELEAYQIARDILKVLPADPVAHITLGRYALKNGETDEARRHYLTAAQHKDFRRYFHEYEDHVGR